MAHSSTSRRKLKQWKEKVANVARAEWAKQSLLTTEPIAVTIFNYCETTFHDVDNIIKPILDALKEQIYQDDRHVFRVVSERIDRTKIEAAAVTSPAVKAVWKFFDEFVYVIVFWEE